MRERNATLLRKYNRFLGPDTADGGSVQQNGRTPREWAMLKLRDILSNGSPKEKRKVVARMIREMGSILTKMSDRRDRRRCDKQLQPGLQRNR